MTTDQQHDHHGTSTSPGSDEIRDGSIHEAHARRNAHNDHDAHAGHDKHEGHSPGMFRDRFWWSLALAVPVVLFSEMVQEWFGYTAPGFPGSDWIAPVLGTVIFVYGGSPFLKGAVREIKDRQPGMMLLIGMAITVAFVASAATTLGWFDLEFWWELAALIIDHAAGPLDGDAFHRPGTRSVGCSGRAAARRRRAGDRRTAPRPVRSPNSLWMTWCLVRPGGRVPADGEIVEGAAEIDESMVTGESRPVAKSRRRPGRGRHRRHRLGDPGPGRRRW